MPESSPNPPIIHPMESQSIVVSESENVGNLVAMVQAEDPDSETLWYSISGNTFYAYNLRVLIQTSFLVIFM